MAYKSKFKGSEIDERLEKVAELDATKLDGEKVGTTEPTEDFEISAEIEAKLAELSEELANELTYKTPLRGVVFGDLTGDAVLRKVLKSIWVEKLNDSLEFPEKWIFYLLRNSDAKTPSFLVQLCLTGSSDVVFTFSSQTKATGLTEIKLAGFSTYKNMVNIYMVLDFSLYQDNANYAGSDTITTYLIPGDLNRKKIESPVTLKETIAELDNKIAENTAEIKEELVDITGELGAQIFTSDKNRIGIYLDNTPDVPQYRFKVLSDDPASNEFSVYKMTREHGNSERIIAKAYIGNWITIDRDAEKPSLYIYDTNAEDSTGYDREYTVEFQNTSSLKQDVENLKNREANDISWKGKTIVCFGDSLTEFKDFDNNKAYPDYIHDFTDATVYNLGIGGSQLRQRRYPVAAPADYKDAYAALDMINMVKACCEQDFSKQIAATNYLTQNKLDSNDAIIALMQTIDWNEVDIVTFFGGANDWSESFDFSAEDSSFDINTTYGAINEIIRLLLTTYPHLRIYWFSPIVSWPFDDNGERTDASWCDNLVRGGATKREFADKIISIVRRNHIPVCDLYSTLGWNKYNFSAYFSDTDGSHPRVGEGNMTLARKIIGFINAHRGF